MIKTNIISFGSDMKNNHGKFRLNNIDSAIVAALALLLWFLLSSVFFSSSAPVEDADSNGDGQVTLADYAGKKIGSITGVNYDDIVEKCIPGAEIEYYSNYPDLVVAMKAGLIDAFIIDEPALAVIMMEDPTVGEIPEDMMPWQMSFGFSSKSEIPNLYENMNSFIRMIKESGEIEEIKDIWFGTDDDVKVIPPLEDLSGENGTVRVALETTYAPIVYIKNKQIVGYEVDILYRYCKYYHYGLEFMDMQYDSVLPAVASGKCDIAASGLEYSEEHADSLLMSEPHLDAATSLAVPASDLGGGAAVEDSRGSLKERIGSSIDKNLLQEDRWQLIVKGIGTTCLITFLSALIGSFAAFE